MPKAIKKNVEGDERPQAIMPEYTRAMGMKGRKQVHGWVR
jgi:hypothetical protein